MGAQGPQTAKVSDLKSLMLAAVQLQSQVDRNGDSSAVQEAIRRVETAATKVWNGLKPSTGPTTIQRCHVDAKAFRSLPSKIREIKASTLMSRKACSTPGNNTQALRGGSLVYNEVKRRLNDIGRPDCMLP